MDESQELNDSRIMKAILKTGFEDYVVQKIIPSWKDRVADLMPEVIICDV